MNIFVLSDEWSFVIAWKTSVQCWAIYEKDWCVDIFYQESWQAQRKGCEHRRLAERQWGMVKSTAAAGELI